MAMEQGVDAIVTGPAEKKALHLAGCRYPGHTEWLGALAGGVETAMMLTTEALRVVLVTIHTSLKSVPVNVRESDQSTSLERMFDNE